MMSPVSDKPQSSFACLGCPGPSLLHLCLGPERGGNLEEPGVGKGSAGKQTELVTAGIHIHLFK